MALAASARKLASSLAVSALVAFAPGTAAPVASAATGRPARADGYGSLPLRFEPNVGQMDGSVLYRSQAAGHDLFLKADEAVISVRGAQKPLTLRLAGAAAASRIGGEEAFAGRTHYYLGTDPGRWRTHVPAYGRVRYAQVYPGIDLLYYGSARQLEYDFVVAPGADPSAIAFDIGGADRVSLSPDGELVLASGAGEIRQRRPLVYQESDGGRQVVAGHYELRGPNRVGFAVGEYDRARPLVIDPVITLAYSTYYGGSNLESNTFSGIAVDGAGAAYIVGDTLSTDLPGAAGPKPGGTSTDVFVAKITPAGDDIEYAVYLGGPATEEGQDIAVDPGGNTYIVGTALGTGFPVLNAFQPTFSGGLGDAIVAKFRPDGTLLYSSYLGGHGNPIDHSYERAHAVAADELGNMYVTGTTASTIGFPIVGGIQSTLRGSFDMFVTKVAPDGRTLVFSTYIGGTLSDAGYDIAVDPDHNVYVAGNTHSLDNPTTPANEGMPVVNAFQPVYGGGVSDAFVLKLNAAGNALVFATYLGGSGPESEDATLKAPTGGIAVDAQRNVYVAGHTKSANFPTTPNRIQPFTGSQEFFVTKLTPAGNQLVYSTWLGGNAFDEACLGLAVDARGSAYVAGWAGSSFPRVNALPGSGVVNTGSRNDAAIAKLTPDGGALVYSTLLGGAQREVLHDIALDGNGHAYVTGATYSATFPLVNPVDPACTDCGDGFFEAGSDAFVTKIFLTNAAPVVAADAFSTDEDVPLSVFAPGVLGNDTDVNPQDVLQAILVAAPQHGSVSLASDGSFTYTPAPDFNGTDAFTYKASDGQLESGTATVTLTVNGTNDAPLADAGGPYAVDEGATLSVTGTAVDPEGDPLTFAWDLDGDGSFETPGQTVSLTAGDGPATRTIFLRVTDTAGAPGMDSALVTIRNLPPIAQADAYATDEDTPLTVAAPGVLGNDSDFDPLVAVPAAGPAHGTLGLQPDGSFVYTPEANFNGTDGFTYRAHDGVDDSAVTAVSITVNSVNDAPTAEAGGPYTVDEGASVALAGGGTDVEPGPLTFAWDLDGDGAFDDATGPTPSFTAGNGPATVTIAVRVTDGDGASATDSATIEVRNVAPAAQADAFATDEDTPLTAAAPGVLGNDSDFDPLTAALVSGPAHGTLTLQADGSFAYTPEANFNGADSFTYRAHDDVTGSGDTVVSLAVRSVNDAPTAEAGGPYAVDEGASLTLSGSGTDVEGGPLTFAWDFDGDGAFDDASGPSPSFDAGNGPATVTVALRVTDAEGASGVDTAVIQVNNVAPVAQADAYVGPGNTTVVVPAPGVLGNDTDFDPLTAALVTPPAHGTLTLHADGSFEYHPDSAATASDSFTYRASDGTAQSAPATVTITLSAPQGGPDAVNDSYVINKRRHRPHRLAVLANDSAGPGGGTLFIVAVTQPQHGTVKVGPGGSVVVYQAKRHFRGIETFTYTVRNSNALTDTATVTVDVRKRLGPGPDDDDDDDHGDCGGDDHSGH